MSKRRIILLIVILVVVNISTYCGYGRMNRATTNKKEIALYEVDSIKILRLIPVPGNPTKYPWRKLSQQQVGDFILTWDKFKGSIPFKMEPSYEIKVYYKGKSNRTLWTFQNDIREGRLYYYCHELSSDYFGALYENAVGK